MMKKLLCAVLCLMLLPISALASVNGVAYEVFVASYADADGDGMGDLNGLTSKLDYIASLGVQAIWLMPISPSPSYHKYDVTDYCAIDAAYGTLADFEAFAAACHARGISVLLDLVLNHTSKEHPWFVSACESLCVEPCGNEICTGAPLCRAHNPYVDYYHFTQESGGHAVPNADGWYYEGQFGDHMPDLNLDSDAVREEIRAICAFWLEHGADGFRLDATTHYTEASVKSNVAFLSWLRATVAQLNPDAYLVGEAWTDESTIASMAQSGISFFAFAFAGNDGYVMKAVQSGNGAFFASRLVDWNHALRAANPQAQDASFLGNHDMARIAGAARGDVAQLKQAMALSLFTTGHPFLYYGDELGMRGSGKDENKRLPMLWSASNDGGCLPPVGADQEQRLKLGVAEQAADPSSLLNYVQALVALRNRCPLLDDCDISLIDTGLQAVAAYRCHSGDEACAVYHNLSDEAVTVLTDESSLLGGLSVSGDVPTLNAQTLALPPHSVCILQ